MVMVDAMREAPALVTVFGGSGFLGRHVVRALARRGYRIRVAVRRPDLAFFLQPLGTVGQIYAMQANLRHLDSVARAAEGADAVVNLVGILQERGRQSFHLHADGAAAIAGAAPPHAALVQVSALGADAGSPSAYARSKAQGEAAVLGRRPDAVVLRPSVMFGRGDTFFNRFAALARALPVLPLAGAETRFQPAWVSDVAEVVARGVERRVPPGRIYELGGPEVLTLRALVEYVLKVTGRRRPIVALPEAAARAQALMLEVLDTLTLGLLPDELRLTRDQVALLRTDNVVSPAAVAEGRTFAGLGLTPEAIEAIVPDYLVRFRRRGQFDVEGTV
jgi:uncharacterized protein YbjT (DUF2867 family)